MTSLVRRQASATWSAVLAQTCSLLWQKYSSGVLPDSGDGDHGLLTVKVKLTKLNYCEVNMLGCLMAGPDSKVHGANMGPISGRQDPGGPHVTWCSIKVTWLPWRFKSPTHRLFVQQIFLANNKVNIKPRIIRAFRERNLTGGINNYYTSK